jgi:hypothetical protein
MATNIPTTSAYVSSYTDKTDDWLKARLAIKENEERLSHKGSIPRRKEIWAIRKELLDRKKAADALAGTVATGPAPVLNMIPAPGKVAGGKLATN